PCGPKLVVKKLRLPSRHGPHNAELRRPGSRIDATNRHLGLLKERLQCDQIMLLRVFHKQPVQFKPAPNEWSRTGRLFFGIPILVANPTLDQRPCSPKKGQNFLWTTYRLVCILSPS